MTDSWPARCRALEWALLIRNDWHLWVTGCELPGMHVASSKAALSSWGRRSYWLDAIYWWLAPQLSSKSPLQGALNGTSISVLLYVLCTYRFFKTASFTSIWWHYRPCYQILSPHYYFRKYVCVTYTWIQKINLVPIFLVTGCPVADLLCRMPPFWSLQLKRVATAACCWTESGQHSQEVINSL